MIKMRRLILSTADKGGTGKSFVAGALAELRIKSETPVLLVDGDPTNPDIARRYGKHLKTEILNLREGDGWLDLIDILDEAKDDVIVSAPAGAGETLQIKVDVLRKAMGELERDLVLVWPIGRTYDSLHLLKTNLEILGDLPTRTVVVMNGFFGEVDKFRRWNESKLRGEVLAQEGNAEHYLIDLHERVVDATSGPFWLGDGLKISARAERDRWLKNVQVLEGLVEGKSDDS